MSVAFTVPGEPKSKGRPRFSKKTGHARTPAATVMFENKVATFAREAHKGAPLKGPLEVRVQAFFAWPKSDHRKREPRLSAWMGKGKDLDNIVKAVLDGMEGIVFGNDSQVASIIAAKMRPQQDEPSRTHVRVRAL